MKTQRKPALTMAISYPGSVRFGSVATQQNGFGQNLKPERDNPGFSSIIGLHCHAIKKIIRKPFGRQSQQIVMLWEINKTGTSPSFKSLRFS